MTTTRATPAPPALSAADLRRKGYPEGFATGWDEAAAGSGKRRHNDRVLRRWIAEHGINFDLGYVDAFDAWAARHPEAPTTTAPTATPAADEGAPTELARMLRF